jgi:N-acetylglucosaminyl-diphospho-decaprenol L-rhamnosyltransferase
MSSNDTSTNECQLSVVIINYKTYDLIVNCLETLLPELLEIDAKVQIVDNYSNDGSAENIERWIEKNDQKNVINLIKSNKNLGFSGGNNLGIHTMNAAFYLLLNSDTLVRKGSIKTLINDAINYPHAGIVSPRLEWPDGRPQESCFRYQTPFSELIWSANTGPITKLLNRYQVALPVSEQTMHPQWTSFACVLIRSDVFKDVGYMDDEFFMYFEDSDFCFLSRALGWDIIHNPIARVVHLRGGSSPVKERSRLKKRLPRYFYESRARYFYKRYGRMGITAANILWWLGRMISKTREVIGNKQSHVCEHQWLDIWTNWWNPMKPYRKP